jgi:DNA invertase Pin-like site-specific DNA recombinase
MAARQRVIGYIRVSTAEQVDGFGLEVQEKAIRTYCGAQKLRLVAILSDEGISGSNGLDSRHGLAEALGRIEAGEATGLVVYRFDRLARDLILQETVYQRLTQKGYQVLSVKEPEQQGDEATANMVRQMLGVISQYEKCVIRGRMAAGRAAKKAKGRYIGGRVPYGYTVVSGDLVKDKRGKGEEAIVDLVTTMRRGGASYRTIVAALADAELTTRRGGAFTPGTVRSIALKAGVA